jgi:ketosteroid isomerase-like protein
MKALFFEDPFWLYGLLLMVEGVGLAIWRRQRTRKSALRLLVPPALAALIFAMATLVVTDRERITAAVNEIAGDVTAGQTTALERYLDDDFHMTLNGQSMGKAQTVARARKVMATSHISKVKIRRLQIEVRGDTATLRLITAIGVKRDGYGGAVPLVWNLRWIKRGKQWRILESTQPRIGTSY